MESKYYHLLLKITPYMCRSYNNSVVISEDPLDWEARNSDRKPTVFKENVQIIQFREISEEIYKKYKKKNPRCSLYSRSGVSNSYLMSQDDWSGIWRREG